MSGHQPNRQRVHAPNPSRNTPTPPAMVIGKKAGAALIFNMTTHTSPIAIILPPREGFSPKAFGAVSLSVKDFTAHSRYRTQTVILGQDRKSVV